MSCVVAQPALWCPVHVVSACHHIDRLAHDTPVSATTAAPCTTAHMASWDDGDIANEPKRAMVISTVKVVVDNSGMTCAVKARAHGSLISSLWAW